MNDETLKPLDVMLKEALDGYHEAQKFKSFSARHPELGRMVNCAVCGERHRSIHVCEQRFAVNKKTKLPMEMVVLPGLTGLTKNQIIGRAAFAKKRIKPHHSKKLLQLVQRTIEIYPLNEGLWPSTETKSAEQVTMEVSRREARAELGFKRKSRKVALQLAQYNSRRINNGLLPGNSKIAH